MLDRVNFKLVYLAIYGMVEKKSVKYCDQLILTVNRKKLNILASLGTYWKLVKGALNNWKIESIQKFNFNYTVKNIDI